MTPDAFLRDFPAIAHTIREFERHSAGRVSLRILPSWIAGSYRAIVLVGSGDASPAVAATVLIDPHRAVLAARSRVTRVKRDPNGALQGALSRTLRELLDTKLVDLRESA